MGFLLSSVILGLSKEGERIEVRRNLIHFRIMLMIDDQVLL